MSEDRELVNRARGGDPDAFGALFDRHAGELRADLAARSRGEAEDLVQEAFLIAWREIHALRDPARFGAWVRRIARNLAASRRAAPPSADPAGLAAPAAPDALRDGAVRAAVAALPEHYRVPIWLRYAEGLSGPEVAQRLGVSHASLRVVLHRGTRLLREKLRRALDMKGE